MKLFGIGAGEFVLILIAGLILFGPSKLPELGKSLGKMLREFRKAQAALSATLEESVAEPVKKSPSPVTENNSAVTVDDVINLAKKNPISEENLHEKISDGVVNNSVDTDNNSSNVNSRSSSDGIKKQSEFAKN